MKRICALTAGALLCCALSCGAEQGGGGMAFAIVSSSFSPGEGIPRDFTADGRDVSPVLAWQNVPVGTRTFALICDDPDAPAGTWVHWLIWNLPASARSLPQGVPSARTLPDGSAQGKNDFGRIGWGGPSPPAGKPHRYFFRLYALKEKLTLPPNASRKELDFAMRGLIIATAEVFGTYKR